MKKVVVVLITLAIMLTSTLAFAYTENDANSMIADTIFLRPLGLAAIVLGGAMYIVSLPVAIITKSQDKTYERLVKEPVEYVFKRPVGEIGSGL